MRLHRWAPGPPADRAADEDGTTQRRHLALLRQAVELLPVGLVVEDGTGTTVLANARAKAPLGELTADALTEAAVGRVMGHARSGEARSETVDIAGARPKRVEVTASPLRGGGAVAVVVDTTERLRLEAVRRDFVANVNHELRTPIGALAVLADALAGERDEATVDRLAGRISTEAARARALIDDLLDFARVEADEQPRHEVVPVAELVDMAVARVSGVAEQQAVSIQAAVGSAGEVHGVREQLVVALANILDNAVKYSEPGSTVWVSTSVDAGPGTVAIAVRDEGIGIPARSLDRIFERFYRVDQARDRRTGGTGLGLAIARHVAANHGGAIDVESREGIGSTFTLRIPAAGGDG